MNRNFYSFGVFFLVLYVVVSLVQSIIFFQIGFLTLSMPSVGSWLLLVVGISLVGYVFTLKYYFKKDTNLLLLQER